MIYFDNAATGGFKPSAVTSTAETVLKYLSANPGRSGHRLSIAGAEIVYNCRISVAKMFNSVPERVIFTKNCTEALNTAIFGTLKKGGHVITTVFEHNSVLRPLNALKNFGFIKLDTVCPDDGKDIVKAIAEKITPDTYLIAVTAVSNVTGETFPLHRIGKLARENNIKLLVDGAQGGGHIPIDLKADNISMLALAGHKGLYGIMGSGALLFDENTDISPLTYGGTGTDSFNPVQPDVYPEKLEAGTLNLPAIAALNEGVNFISKNITNFNEQMIAVTEKLILALEELDGITVYSHPNPSGIVSFLTKHTDSTEVADILNKKYDIAVRGGFHCAPLMHKYLGTENSGLVRVSLAIQNSSSELSYFIRALKEICKG